MKTTLLALSLISLSALSHAAAAPQDSPEGLALRSECAQKYSAGYAARDAAAKSDTDEYVFVYHKGQYKGEHVAGQTLDCTERQYAAYLNTVDPTRVMAAYPTAAGRPSIKAPRLPRTPSVGK
ncbi:hypothetical protein C1O66_12350 [Paucibacter aquatile]|jgi:hypothetical protein|uniref:Uncharacterized protein n=1 Tax=Kinneretia aquatilis TaxID=2070761 RepID=A0A2N8KXP8_9BURK|nr:MULTISPECIES: hypothetical protein [Roseateles]PND38235.1 hypothetical protein C1O66_12350 [Paucibacter aquatile]